MFYVLCLVIGRVEMEGLLWLAWWALEGISLTELASCDMWEGAERDWLECKDNECCVVGDTINCVFPTGSFLESSDVWRKRHDQLFCDGDCVAPTVWRRWHFKHLHSPFQTRHGTPFIKNHPFKHSDILNRSFTLRSFRIPNSERETLARTLHHVTDGRLSAAPC